LRHVIVPLRSDDLVRRSDKHDAGMSRMCSSDAAEYQENTHQQRNTQDYYKGAYHQSLPNRDAVHKSPLSSAATWTCTSAEPFAHSLPGSGMQHICRITWFITGLFMVRKQ
jgi:hypothetical protein